MERTSRLGRVRRTENGDENESIHLNIFQVNNPTLELLVARRFSLKKQTVDQWLLRDMILRKLIEMEPKERRTHGEQKKLVEYSPRLFAGSIFLHSNCLPFFVPSSEVQ
jgi:hypothetical protein